MTIRQWLAFSTGPGEGPTASELRPYIVKLQNGLVAPGGNWIPVANEHGSTVKPRWSPDGNTLYFLSHRDGFRCIWAQRLRGTTKEPVGDPIAVYHFHNSSLSPRNVGLVLLETDVSADKFVITLGELTGKIWMLARRS